MPSKSFHGSALAALVIAAGALLSSPAAAQPGPNWGPGNGCGGPGWMGPGMMWGGGGWGPGGMGPGMMWGGGWGPGYGGWGAQQQADLNLTVPQVKARMEQWIAASGNPNVKLGDVKQKDANTITAEIVTAKGGTTVESYDINLHSGYMQPAQN